MVHYCIVMMSIFITDMNKTLEIRYLVILIFIILIVTLSITTGYLSRYYFDNSVSDQYKSNVTSMDGGIYMRLIFIGSTSCPFCTDDVHEQVRIIKTKLKKSTEVREIKYLTTGISVDLNSIQGTKYLEKSGYYDEVISGGSWLNNGVQKYNWSYLQQPATPQIIISKSIFDVVSSLNSITSINLSEEILFRYEGTDQINQLYELLTNNKYDELFEKFVE